MINLRIHLGEFVAIMGKSGSGKSTLLNQIGMIDSPDSGKIIYMDENILDFGDQEKNEFRLRNFGFVFQEHILFPELNVLENVYLPGLALGISQSESKKKAEEILKILDMGNRKMHYPYELSGGQKQRVSVARALINNPKMLLLDEPTANLDSKNSEELLKYMRKINLLLGTTIVMVTHDEEDKNYVDRAVYLKDGKLIKEEVLDSKRLKKLSRPPDNEIQLKNLIDHIKSKRFSRQDADKLIGYYKKAHHLQSLLDIEKRKKYHKDIVSIYKIAKKIICVS
jgi:putative ABC transport system ATP-binding protein